MFQIPFLDKLRSVVSLSPIDDFVDVISCFATAAIYLFGAILISARTYVGSPIQCWIPQTYSSSWEEYVETYCFLKNTFFVAHHDAINEIEDESRTGVPYYQWASMYLAIMAMFFVIPKMFWSKSQSATDIPLSYFCETTNEIKKTIKENRNGKIQEMATLINDKLHSKHVKTLWPSFVNISIAYYLTKLFYIINIIFQFLTISHFLGQGSNYLWGYYLFKDLLMNRRWTETGVFPRITYCSFSIRQLSGSMNNHAVQCVLGVNEFNEKIFLFIWHWLIVAFFATIIGTIYIVVEARKQTSIVSLLSPILKNHQNPDVVNSFVNHYLKSDGKLIMMYIKMQSDVVAQELAAHLFHNYSKQLESQRNHQNLIKPLIESKIEVEASA